MANKKKDKTIYEVVTERFIDELSKGELPWKKPWVTLSSEIRCGGWSHDTGQPYSLLNQMLLPKEGEYLTFNDCKKEGGKVKKGAKGYPIFFWKIRQTTEKNKDTNLDEVKTIPVLRYYTMFHIDDTEGIRQKYQKDEPVKMTEPDKCKEAEEIISNYAERESLVIIHKAQDQAYYSPTRDEVVLPLKKQFKKKAEYYSTVFHELTHSTGSENRLKRFHGAKGDVAYSFEELVAEIGASVFLRFLGLETEDSHKNNTAYIQSWIKVLNNNPRMIVKAAGKAQKAVDLIYGKEIE